MGEKRLGARHRFNKTNIERAPKRAGIYVVRNPHGATQYVGMSRNIRTRLRQHLTEESIPNASTYQMRTCRSSTRAANLERDYIKKYNPRYNILKNKK
jgi:excinuclease UvrABC nuclease subunit